MPNPHNHDEEDRLLFNEEDVRYIQTIKAIAISGLPAKERVAPPIKHKPPTPAHKLGSRSTGAFMSEQDRQHMRDAGRGDMV